MAEKGNTTDNRSMHVTILGVLGILFAIIGAAIIAIPGMPGRGSGIGTGLVVLGVVLLIIAFLRLYYKRP